MKIQYLVFVLCIGQSFANYDYLQFVEGLGAQCGDSPVYKSILDILTNKTNNQGTDLNILVNSLNAEDVQFATEFFRFSISGPLAEFDTAVEKYTALWSELENSNATLFPNTNNTINPVVYNTLKSASANIKSIQTIFMVCITTFENFLQQCSLGLNGAKTINNNTAFTEKKSVVNALLTYLSNLTGITKQISIEFENMNKYTAAIKPLLALDLPAKDVQLLGDIEKLSSAIAQCYQDLSVDDNNIVTRMPNIIFNVNSVDDEIKLKNIMPDFTGPLISICKTIYAIGQNSADVTTDIQKVMSSIDTYIMEKQLDL